MALKALDRVIFSGCSDEQHRWGNHTGNPHELAIGKPYTIERVEEHTWHTKIFLQGIKGSFNSVCFEEVVEP